MKTSQNFLSLGILVIIVGIVLIVIGSSTGIEVSTFFFFPFFFFSTSDVIVVFLLIALTFFIFVIMIWPAITNSGQVGLMYDEKHTGDYIHVGAKCSYCSKPLPVDAKYCSNCGNPIGNDKASNQ